MLMTQGMSYLNLCVECVRVRVCVCVCLAGWESPPMYICVSGHVYLRVSELCGSALHLYLCVCESEYLSES